jgi:CRP/FNR family transcriptional regulator, cyclic AMP receptor protein
MRPRPSIHFDLANFIATLKPRKIVYFRKNQVIFLQGEPSDSIFYIEKGNVKLSLTSKQGKEALIGVFARGELFGESCVLKVPLHLHGEIATTEMRVLKIHCNVMRLALGSQGLAIQTLADEKNFYVWRVANSK